MGSTQHRVYQWLLNHPWSHPFAHGVFKLYWFLFRPKTFGVKCVLWHGDQVLMIRNTYGRKRWTFPGGGIETGETPKEATKREVFEEVGISVNRLEELGTFTSTLEYKKDTITVFQIEINDMDFQIDPKEILEARWFSRSQLPVMSPIAEKIVSFFK